MLFKQSETDHSEFDPYLGGSSGYIRGGFP